MSRRAIALVLSSVALSGCGALPSVPGFNLSSSNAPGTPVHVTSVPPGAEASFATDGRSCTTPCTLTAPNGMGTYNVSFKLNGYQPQSVPVRIAVNESSSMQSGDAGTASNTVITPDPVMAELEPFAPAAVKPPAARTKAKPAKTTVASSAPRPAPSHPPAATRTAAVFAPAPASLPQPAATTTAATSAPPAATTIAEVSAPPPASSPQPVATTTAATSAPPPADSPAGNGKLGVWDSISRWWNER
ncbi:MAG: hypothetical protein JO230_09000 [Xanthobacteraceae bacterium]|nr:hypothetical protein [Xanthobacteraceae bacterium]